MTMTVPLTLKAAGRTLRWSGGGLLLLLSVALHGLLLGMPLPEASDPEAAPAHDLAAAEVIDVVRLPAPTPPVDAAPAAPPEPSTAVIPPDAAPRAQAAPRSPQPAAPAAPVPAPAPGPPAPDLLPAEPPPAPPPTLDDRLRDPAAYVFGGQAKSAVLNQTSFFFEELNAWIEQERQGVTDDNQLAMPGAEQAPLTVPYVLSECLDPAPGVGAVGVLVGGDGQRLKDPVLLDSTGYAILDEKALELARDRTFAAAAGLNPQAHWLPVQVQYDPARCQL